ncbi:MAG: hypothetical protein M1827_000847 [Pycnora praestabilis]|nr:MAG: hypothetical protein M1827_000847 [Pycnora praestabilis]
METQLNSASGVFRKDRHIKYWLRCLKSYLPTGYTPNDSNRVTLAFFIVSALDLLDCLDSHTTSTERQGYAEWIYHCQLPSGGFRGFPGASFGQYRTDENKHWDPASLPATFFALAALLALGDDLQRVKRRECLTWINKLQNGGGDFGETLSEKDFVEGGQDVRFCMMAAGVRRILRGRDDGAASRGIPDIDVDGVVDYIHASETYDGGYSEGPYLEAHAGYTYCAVGTLSLLGRLPPSRPNNGVLNGRQSINGARKVRKEGLEKTIHWLVSRQTSSLEDEEESCDEGEMTDTAPANHFAHSLTGTKGVVVKTDDIPRVQTPELSHLEDELLWSGFSGRCNKIADTCYSWWVLGTLSMLHKTDLTDAVSHRRYLLEKSQHTIGGFSKLPGDPPDIYHSYMGLAALAVMGDPAVKAIDATLCLSVSAREFLESLDWWKGNIDQTNVSDKTLRTVPTNRAGINISPDSYISISGG